MTKSIFPTLVAVLLLSQLAGNRASAGPSHPPYYHEDTVALADGRLAKRVVIAGPATPPRGYERGRLAAPRESALPAGSKLLSVPAYEWSFGCSATSAAMIAAYYDRGAYPNMYAGPTNGGVMPMDSSVWGTWKDGYGDTYAQCPITASRQGLDGRSTRGSMDDYWVGYGSGSPDPYITHGWTSHPWSEAVGDYMKTSQSAYGNSDGGTMFWYWNSADPFTCKDAESLNPNNDGTYGVKAFYEARGYTVTDCYNQPTDNNTAGGFSYVQYKAEIDAGRPVMLGLEGHTVVGVGYAGDEVKTIYIHDTWDYETHTMTWGGSYADMPLNSVSIVHLVCPAVAGVSGLAISKVNNTDVKLTWNAVAGSDHYEIWSAANKPFFTPGANCASPAPYSCQTVASTSLTTKALGDPANNHTYVAKAANACGATSTGGSNRAGSFGFPLVHP